MAAQELEEVIANRESASTTETVLLCDAYADAVAQVIENPSTADGLSNGKSIPRWPTARPWCRRLKVFDTRRKVFEKVEFLRE